MTGVFNSIADAIALGDPAAKCEAVEALYAEHRPDFRDRRSPVDPIGEPGRPARPKLVDPSDLPRRRLGRRGGRSAFIHAIAHIEFNAINLALDAAYRFRDMPERFTLEWLSVAADEARHFRMLDERLHELGHRYGDFPAHDGLWEMARRTAHSCLARMALVPRVLEARGLDVTPGMIARFRSAGDERTVAILEVILEEEVRHVAVGSEWFRQCCRHAEVEPLPTFLDLLDTYFGKPRAPFNVDARLLAGFTREEIAALEKKAA